MAPDAATRAHVAAALRLALAHHPLCDAFDADVHRAAAIPSGTAAPRSALRVCRGCAAAVAGLLLGIPVGITALGLGADPLALAVASLVFGGPQAATYAWRFAPPVRSCAKVLGGMGVGILTVAALAGAWPWPWSAAGAGALAMAAVAGQLLRMRTILRTCDACPWARRWDACPGLRAEGGASGHPLVAAGSDPRAVRPAVPRSNRL